MKTILITLFTCLTIPILTAQTSTQIKTQTTGLMSRMDFDMLKMPGSNDGKEQCAIKQYQYNRHVIFSKSNLTEAQFLDLEKKIWVKLAKLKSSDFKREYLKYKVSKDPNEKYLSRAYYDYFTGENKDPNKPSGESHFSDILGAGASGAGVGAGIGGGVGLLFPPEGVAIGAAIGAAAGAVIGVLGEAGSKIFNWLAGGKNGAPTVQSSGNGSSGIPDGGDGGSSDDGEGDCGGDSGGNGSDSGGSGSGGSSGGSSGGGN